MTVSIIIPNWNGVNLLKKHLRRVIEVAPKSEIVVADDASSDESLDFLRQHFPAVKVVRQNIRRGFAENVNAGVKAAHGDIILLLNTDVEPEKGFSEALLSHFKDPDVFAVGCLDKSFEESKVILRGRGIAHWYRGFFVHARGEVDKKDTAWVSGGSGAFRKSMWDELGGMDTLYSPFYWEDIDLSYRARKAGWKIVFEPKSIVRHYHEEGKIKREFTPAQVKRISYRNQFLFIWKNLTDTSILFSHAVWTPVRLVQALVRGDFMMIRGYMDALWNLAQVFRKRRKQTLMYTKGDSSLDIWD